MFIPVTYFNNLDEGSTFISASGGTISYDGIYKIHTFTTTGSNTFIGTEIFSGSVRGQVFPIAVSSLTASMDCSLGNFFTLTLQSSTNTRLVATNIQPGETISLRVTQPATPGTISYPSNFKFPNFGMYSASVISNAQDIVTFISFDSTNLYGVNVKNMI